MGLIFAKGSMVIVVEFNKFLKIVNYTPYEEMKEIENPFS